MSILGEQFMFKGLMKKLVILIFYLFASNRVLPVNSPMKMNDTAKVNLLNSTARELRNSNPDSCILLAKQAKIISKKTNYTIGLAEACIWQGTATTNLGNYDEAIELLKRALELLSTEKNLKANRLKGRAYNNLGNVFWNKGLYTEAMKYHYASLRIKKQMHDNAGIASSYNNIGNTQSQQEQYEEALISYSNALKISLKEKDERLTAILYDNLGLVYFSLSQNEKALDNYAKALKIHEKFNEISGISITKSNIALCLEEQKKYDESLKYHFESLSLKKQLGDQHGISISSINIGSVYLTLGKFSLANNYFHQALNLSTKLMAFQEIKGSYYGLYKTAEQLNDYSLTLKYYKLYNAYKDSISNEENTKKQTQMEMQYVFDNKQAADSIKNAAKSNAAKQKNQLEIKQQQLFTYGGIIGFALMLIVAIISFRAFKNKQKANALIEQQKLMVEEKQKEILDSIHYANRIQRALLPNEKYIARVLTASKMKNE
jgi:tetratricopeptide (TPR) repeat protein